VIKGLPLIQGEEAMSHLHVVDDNILMGYPTVKEVVEFKTILDLFQRHLATFLSFQLLSLFSKYLGAPLLSKVLHDPSWEMLLEKMEFKLQSWTHRSLSM
jgi:hypothetical protein